MDEPLEDVYFNWLCTKVLRLENPTPSLSYWNLLKQLHGTEFVWLTSGDDNRAEDGVDLRLEFFKEAYLKPEQSWYGLGCSILEMMIAFSRRAAFDTERDPKEWFWEFLNNLGLDEFNDASDATPDEVDDILNTFMWRTYAENGEGGMFPLKSSDEDQRSIEIWYQFCEYLIEKEQ